LILKTVYLQEDFFQYEKSLYNLAIPIVKPSLIAEHKPDWLLIFPWNIADEVISQQAQIKDWDGKFVVAIPELKILA